MKKNIRLISLLLSLIMLTSVFVACEKGSEETSAQDTEAVVTPDTTVEETEGSSELKSFDLIVNGETTVKIIRPADLPSNDPAVVAALAIRDAVKELTGAQIKLADDFKKATEEYDNSTFEILVGKTDHPHVAEAIADLGYADYTVKLVGNKIVVFGFTDTTLTSAVEAFSKIIENNTVTNNDTVSVSIPVEALNVTGSGSNSEMLAALPVFDGAAFTGFSYSDLSGEQVILEDATADEYNAYIAKLEASGYKKYTSNDMSGNLFTTLYNSETTLNVGFYKPYKECRIIMEPFSEKTLIGLESDNKYTAVTTSQITMLGCEYKESSGSYKGNGLSLLFRLADGSFVIVDGGHTTNSSYWANNLINAIEEQAKDYATGKNIRIAAWFVSHAHGDHMGMLRKEASKFASKFTVERVIANLMSEEELAKSFASSHGSNFGSGDGTSTNYVRQAAKTLGAEMISCHTGQRFYFGDTVFEILYTVDDFVPSITNALNTSTILVRAITTDAKGNTSTMMVMGDVTGPAMAKCNKLYGTDLKCEIVQVAHHGYSTWGNDSAIASSYKYMSPEIVLWPQGSHAFPNYKEKSYSKVLWDGTNKSFKALFVAGWNNTQHIVPLPYNGDPASVISKITVEG
jgi:beta-lactamase superfamily II metal-dependent hydrolase